MNEFLRRKKMRFMYYQYHVSLTVFKLMTIVSLKNVTRKLKKTL